MLVFLRGGRRQLMSAAAALLMPSQVQCPMQHLRDPCNFLATVCRPSSSSRRHGGADEDDGPVGDAA